MSRSLGFKGHGGRLRAAYELPGRQSAHLGHLWWPVSSKAHLAQREFGTMDDYNFWQDFFDTYQSLSDWMKFAWLVVPPGFVLGLIALLLHRRWTKRHMMATETGELIYTIHRDSFDQLHIRHYDATSDSQPPILFLDEPGTGHVVPHSLDRRE